METGTLGTLISDGLGNGLAFAKWLRKLDLNQRRLGYESLRT
jgi:hypothetical protein